MEIRPFRGWRYCPADGDVGALIAPPYDVLSAADKAALLARDERNIVAVDLPHCPIDEAGPDGAYDEAAATLAAWRRAAVLAQDPRPSLYAYQQSFTWAGRSYCRRTLVAAVRLAEFGQGVWPHERTFAGPPADRFKLNEKTGMQLSAVFGFYEDHAGVSERLFAAADRPADAAANLNGVAEKLWVVSDGDVIEAVRAELAGRDLFIADGHHRYTTGLRYRDSLGPIDPDHPANFILFALAAMNDPGLIILPPHRVLTGLRDFDLKRFMARTREVMDYQPIRLAAADVADADALLRRHGRHTMAFAAGDSAVLGRLKDASVMDRVAAEQVPAWRELDVSVLHCLLIDQFLAGEKTERTHIDYVAAGPAALAAATTGRADLVVFLQATRLDAIRQISLAGTVMPHKSTYFYPKIASGIVLYPLRP